MNKLPLHTKVQVKLKNWFLRVGKRKIKVWHKCLRDNNSYSTFKWVSTKYDILGFSNRHFDATQSIINTNSNSSKGTNARQRFTNVEKK